LHERDLTTKNAKDTEMEMKVKKDIQAASS